MPHKLKTASRAPTLAVPSALLILFAGALPSANAEGPFFGLSSGMADADITGAIFVDGDSVSAGADDALLTGGVFGGYEWDNGVFVEASYHGYANLTAVFFADAIEIEAVRTVVGYYLPSDSKLHVLGKFGVNFWNVEARESFAFNPGPEETASLDGTDLFAEVGVEYRFTDRWRAGLAISYSDFDIGSATALNLSLKIAL